MILLIKSVIYRECKILVNHVKFSKLMSVSLVSMIMFSPAVVSVAHSQENNGYEAILEDLSKQIDEPKQTPGYSRREFGDWLSVKNTNSIGWEDFSNKRCDVRKAVLIEQGYDVVSDEECNIVSGKWVDPYVDDAVPGLNSSEFDIDHVVALSEAWRSGASNLTRSQRAQIHNDRDNLIISGASTNRSKGDSNVADWFPENNAPAFCEYMVKYATVKSKYDLTLTQEEYNKLSTELNGRCLNSSPGTQDGDDASDNSEDGISGDSGNPVADSTLNPTDDSANNSTDDSTLIPTDDSDDSSRNNSPQGKDTDVIDDDIKNKGYSNWWGRFFGNDDNNIANIDGESVTPKNSNSLSTPLTNIDEENNTAKKKESALINERVGADVATGGKIDNSFVKKIIEIFS